MPGIRLNFSEVTQNTDFPVNEPGEYLGRITNVEQKVGKSSGQPYLNVEGKLDEGTGKVWAIYSLQPQSLWRLKQLLVRLGWDEQDLAEDIDFDADDLIGKQALFVLTVEEYEGKERNKVVDIKSPDDVSGGW